MSSFKGGDDEKMPVGHEAVDITYHYAHLFPTVQTDMAAQLETEREALVNVRKE